MMNEVFTHSLVALSELYNVQIQIFNSLESWEPITRISTVKGEMK